MESEATGLHFNCDRCGEPITEPGALLFGPPRKHRGGFHTTKYHLCGECYRETVGFMRRGADRGD